MVGWHRKGFKLFWKWKSQTRRRGRPPVPREIIHLIRRMASENPIWTPERIQSELALLGHDVAETTVAKYMGRRWTGSPTWMTFLRNHLPVTAACDFFTVRTATFQVPYCFLILSHDRRRIVHFNVTEHRTQSGLPSRSWRLSLATDPCPSTSSATETGSMATTFADAFATWGFGRSPRAGRHLGGTIRWRERLAPFEGNVWTCDRAE